MILLLRWPLSPVSVLTFPGIMCSEHSLCPGTVLLLYKHYVCHFAASKGKSFSQVHPFCPRGVIYFSYIKDIAVLTTATVHSTGASLSYPTCASAAMGTVSFRMLLTLFNMCQPFHCAAQLFESKFQPTVSDDFFLQSLTGIKAVYRRT